MARPVLQVKGYTAESIKSKFRDDERYTIGLRLYAVYQVALGQPSRKLEELYNTSFKQITNWVHRFEQGGVEGLVDRPRSGRTPKLNQDQLKAISVVLNNDLPTKYNYNTATWTGPLLIDWINVTYKIEFKKAQIYNILKSLGFSYQKGRGIFPEANETKREGFKESLKKTSRRRP
jgi:transposase